MNKLNLVKLVAVVFSCVVTGAFATSVSMHGKVGKFTPVAGDKCDPTCEGTYTVNGKKENALLVLVNDKTAEIIAPYEGKDFITMKDIKSFKPVIIGSWKKDEEGSIVVAAK